MVVVHENAHKNLRASIGRNVLLSLWFSMFLPSYGGLAQLVER